MGFVPSSVTKTHPLWEKLPRSIRALVILPITGTLPPPYARKTWEGAGSTGSPIDAAEDAGRMVTWLPVSIKKLTVVPPIWQSSRQRLSLPPTKFSTAPSLAIVRSDSLWSELEVVNAFDVREDKRHTVEIWPFLPQTRHVACRNRQALRWWAVLPQLKHEEKEGFCRRGLAGMSSAQDCFEGLQAASAETALLTVPEANSTVSQSMACSISESRVRSAVDSNLDRIVWSDNPNI